MTSQLHQSPLAGTPPWRDGISVVTDPLLDANHPSRHKHLSHRSNWLRAAVLGANDGTVTIGAMLVGMSMAASTRTQLLISAVAALVAGSLSMATGEYISVQAQADAEKADVEIERRALAAGPHTQAAELEELIGIYVNRGLRLELAREVAIELTAHDAVRTHARDELGIDIDDHPNALQAALASAVAFAVGGVVPITALLIRNPDHRYWGLVVIVTLTLATLGALGSWLGGMPLHKGITRTLLGGWLAMVVTMGAARLFGSAIG